MMDRNSLGSAASLRRAPQQAAKSIDEICVNTIRTLAIDALAARERLAPEGIAVRVVSMPSWELFERQEQAYRDAVLPPDLRARVSVEAASTLGWERYVGASGAMIGMHTFGASAPYKDLLRKFGFTVEKVVEAARQQIGAAREARP